MRLIEPLKAKYNKSTLRISLNTDSVKHARIERDKILGQLRIEHEILTTNNPNTRFYEILKNLRLERDSEPEEFNVLSPDYLSKQNDKDYVSAYIVAANEQVELITAQNRVKAAKSKCQLTLLECKQLYLKDHQNMQGSAANQYNLAVKSLPENITVNTIDKLVRQDIKDFIQNTDLAFNTISGRVSRLKNMVKYAIDEEKFTGKNPLDGIDVKALTGDDETDSYQN